MRTNKKINIPMDTYKQISQPMRFVIMSQILLELLLMSRTASTYKIKEECVLNSQTLDLSLELKEELDSLKKVTKI